MSGIDFRRLRPNADDCPSDLALDRLFAHEVDPAQRVELEGHVAACAPCDARMRQRRSGFERMSEVDPRRMLARIRTRSGQLRPARPWLRALLAPLLAFGLAAGVVLLASGSTDAPTHRAKGQLSIHVYRMANGEVEALISGAPVSAGDRLRFVVDLPSEGHVGIFGLQADGELYTAWPLEPGVQTRRAAGSGIELAGAVALDDSRGQELLHLVHCPLDVGPPRCASTGPAQKPACPETCAISSFVLEKRP